MKAKIITTLIVIVGGFSFSNLPARAAAPELVEVGIEKALIPQNGYDDNDNVEVVLHGYLSNACYSLSPARFEKDDSGNTIRVRQFAWHQVDGICAQSQSLPIHLNMVIPFSVNLSLGRLTSGRYEIESLDPSGSKMERSFFVEVAPAPSIDSFPYAATSSASMPDVVRSGDSLKLSFEGVLTSSCTELNPQVNIRREGDVIIVLPILTVYSDVYCAQVLRPFEKTVNLGRFEAGTYLVHIRSMNGRSVNQVFEVIDP